MNDLAGIRCFVRVAELGSFSRAARELRVSQPTVSKTVAALEQRLGVRLLQRTTRSLGLTEEGARYYDTCLRVLAELDEVESSLATGGREPRGTLRLTSPREHGELLVAPVVLRFLDAHPQLSVDLVLDDRRIDLSAERIDLALRLGVLEDSSLVARRLGAFSRLTAAAPVYLERHGEPTSPGDLAGHDCLVHTALSDPGRWTFRDERGRATRVDVSGRLAASSNLVVRDAALAGLGVFLGPRWLVQDALADGRLRPVLASYTVPSLDVHAVYPGGPFVPLKVRAFVHFLREAWLTEEVLR